MQNSYEFYDFGLSQVVYNIKFAVFLKIVEIFKSILIFMANSARIV